MPLILSWFDKQWHLLHVTTFPDGTPPSPGAAGLLLLNRLLLWTALTTMYSE
jgi:hypothetical protein